MSSSPSKKDSPLAPASQQQSYATQLSSDSTAFAYIEYFLRLSLGAATARITAAWEVSNPQLTLQFDKKSRGLLCLDSWVDVADIPSEEGGGEEEVLRRGFSLRDGGMKFATGHLKPAATGEGKVSRRFLLCKIVVGRAYNAAEAQARSMALPEGYDSFLLDANEDEGTAVREQPSMQYIIKDSAQILPAFIATFEWDAEEERRSRQRVTCENCEKRPATVFCKADAANLCSECDGELHQSKLAQKHQRVSLAQGGPQAFSPCRQHPDKLVEFFCPTCSRSVCVVCKMVGHHSIGDAAKHRLVTIGEAFKTVSEAAGARDPILDARKEAIAQRLQGVVERAKAVQENSASTAKQLEELYRRAEADLLAVTRRKLNVLRGDARELSRQAHEIDALDAFLRYQQSGGDAMQFILDWAQHQRLRNELHAFPHTRDALDVQADTRIHGSVQIVQSGTDVPVQGIDFERPKYGGPVASSASRRGPTPSIFDLGVTKSRKPTEMD